jgi:CubicO group peptidase (beta-lactamase class C family)
VLVRGDRALRAAAAAGVAAGARRPERALFRVASISKLFTTTAALQLVEQGRIVGDDVNRHLRSLRVRTLASPCACATCSPTRRVDDRFIGVAAPEADPPETLRAHSRVGSDARVRRAIQSSEHGSRSSAS